MDIKAEFFKNYGWTNGNSLGNICNNVPNVRIVNFYFEPAENILYFSSFKGNDKVKEINANPNVAFTTILTKEMSMSKLRG